MRDRRESGVNAKSVREFEWLDAVEWSDAGLMSIFWRLHVRDGPEPAVNARPVREFEWQDAV